MSFIRQRQLVIERRRVLPNVLFTPLANMLSIYVSQTTLIQAVVLPLIPFSCNKAMRPTTGVSPLYLVYGSEALSAPDTILIYPCNHAADPSIGESSRSAEFCHQLAQAHTKEQQIRRICFVVTSTADMSNITLRPGHLLFSPCNIRHCTKCLPRYQSPYRVVREISQEDYEVEPASSSTVRRVDAV